MRSLIIIPQFMYISECNTMIGPVKCVERTPTTLVQKEM